MLPFDSCRLQDSLVTSTMTFRSFVPTGILSEESSQYRADRLTTQRPFSSASPKRRSVLRHIPGERAVVLNDVIRHETFLRSLPMADRAGQRANRRSQSPRETPTVFRNSDLHNTIKTSSRIWRQRLLFHRVNLRACFLCVNHHTFQRVDCAEHLRIFGFDQLFLVLGFKIVAAASNE